MARRGKTFGIMTLAVVAVAVYFFRDKIKSMIDGFTRPKV